MGLSKETKRTVCEMTAGIVLYNAVLAVLATLILPQLSCPLLPVLTGLLIGAAGAVLMLVHMASTMERALDSQNENYANRYTVVQSLLRRVVFVAAIFFCWWILKADLLAAVIGAMGMKAGAYLQPVIRKHFRQEEKETAA